jgi:hypothetical protein
LDVTDIANRFAFHAATTEEKRADHGTVRQITGDAALLLNDVVPEGREKALMMTALETVMFWGNAAIARNK